MALQTVPGVRKAEKSTQGAYIKSSAIVTRTTTYAYDKAGNLIKETDCNGNSIQYDYDAYDRVIRVTDQDGITTRAFYDEEGNITKVVDPEHYDPKKDDGKGETYVYDKQDGTWQQNVYDATGLRMATVENGTCTGYTYDGDNILAEYNKDDSRTTRYIRGYDLISQKNDAGETYHYLHNAHGDITKLVDTAGKVQNSYSYDAFGNTTSYSEKVGNKFRYAGEQYDSITGEYYLRARYYDPAMGRFMNEDTYKGQIENPQSMNLYAYCLNNPVIYIDPSGHSVAKCSSGQGTGKNKKGTGNTTKVVSPVWQSSDANYSPAIQSKLLELNFDWYFADSIKEQNSIVQRAKNIRADIADGAGWWLDKAGKITSAAADEFSWFLGGSPSANERDKWLELNQMFHSDLTIKDNQSLKAGMFIAGILMPTGSGEANAAGRVLKSWIKHGTYNEVKKTLGKEGVEQFIKAMNKGIVSGVKENGIKLLDGKGIKAAGKYYKYELKVLGKGTSHYRILGNFDSKTGHVIFEKLVNFK